MPARHTTQGTLRNTLWLQFIRYLNSWPEVTRQGMHDDFGIRRTWERPTRLDDYRNLLQRAGWVAPVARGVYRKTRTIPETLTVVAARLQGKRTHVQTPDSAPSPRP